jgi:hypothetical protein
VTTINKLEEPISFIIWADDKSPKKMQELEYFKELAKNDIDEKREEFIIYSPNPEQYKSLILEPQFERFTFASNKWAEI